MADTCFAELEMRCFGKENINLSTSSFSPVCLSVGIRRCARLAKQADSPEIIAGSYSFAKMLVVEGGIDTCYLYT